VQEGAVTVSHIQPHVNTSIQCFGNARYYARPCKLCPQPFVTMSKTCGDEDPGLDMNTENPTFLESVLKDLVVRTGDLESFHGVGNLA
jgi:hypothetical protein